MKDFEPSVELLRSILQGDAVLLVGAGASAEMGYPDWKTQTEAVLDVLQKRDIKFNEDELKSVVDEGRFSDALGLISRLPGMDKQKLVDILRDVTKPCRPGFDRIYSTITSWPISCFITTNFDNEIKDHLERNATHEHFAYLENKESDLALMGASSDKIVFKIHGSLDDASNAVVTYNDYIEFKSSEKRQYYRDALERLFASRNVIIIGYSLKDEDVQYILERLKVNASPIRPVYMFAPDVRDVDVELFEDRYNVRIVSYPNADRSFAILHKILAIYNQFIVAKPINKHKLPDSDKATSLYIMRKLNADSKSVDVDNYVLMNLKGCSERGLQLSDIVRKLSGYDCLESLRRLVAEGYVVDENGYYRCTHKGDLKIQESVSAYNGIKNAAIQNLIQDFGTILSTDEQFEIGNLAVGCIEKIFSKHGLSMAGNMFAERCFDGDDMVGVFEIISQATAGLSNIEHKLLFIQAIKRFLINPTKHQRRYMIALSQGFFAYYFLKYDPNYAQAAKDVLRQDCWFVDSNILQPLCALGCPDHKFVEDMFALLKQLKVELYTTPGVVKEVLEHLCWARNNIPVPSRYRRIDGIPANTARYNFFQHGFVRMALDGEVSSFYEYEDRVSAINGEELESVLERYSIKLQSLDKLEYAHEYQQALEEVAAVRKANNTLSENALQVPTEAELYVLMKQRRTADRRIKANREIHFLSTSSIFRRTKEIFKKWTCHSLYRYAQMLLPPGIQERTMEECLKSEIFNLGFNLIDEESYNKYFKSEINLAELKYSDEIAYMKQFSQSEALEKVSQVEEEFNQKCAYDRIKFASQLINTNNRASFEDLRQTKSRLAEAEQELINLRKELQQIHSGNHLEKTEDSDTVNQKKTNNKKRKKKVAVVKQKAANKRSKRK